MVVRLPKGTLSALLALASLLAAQSAFALSFDSSSILSGDGGYSDTGLSLSPFAAGGGPGLFTSNPGYIGITGGGNDGAINNADGLLGGGDGESLEVTFSSGYGMSGLDLTYFRGDVLLSGFTANPLASAADGATSDPLPGTVSTWDGVNNTLQISQDWRAGNVSAITFANPGASTNQVIEFNIVDPNQAAPAVSLVGAEWEIATPIIAGDVDGDGDVDLNEIGGDGVSDFDIIRDHWFANVGSRDLGDLTADGIVDFDDFGEWKTAFNQPIVGSIQAGFTVVPEPHCCVLLGLGLLSLAAGRRRS